MEMPIIICIVLLLSIVIGIGYAINKWKRNIERGLGQ